MKKILFVIILLHVIIDLAHCQQVFRIWEGDPEYSTVSGDTIPEIYEDRGFKSVKNITIPSIIAYLPLNPNGMSVIICPGGAYGFEAIDVEGTNVAEWFKTNGIAAFVLKYRLPDEQYMQNKHLVPMLDALQAISFVRQKAEKWGISKNKIGIMGFSAGGHLASSVSVHYNEKELLQNLTSCQPDFTVLVYPVIFSGANGHGGSSENLLGKNPDKVWLDYFSNDKQVSKDTPPTIIFHSINDNTVSPINSISYFLALREKKIRSELHIFSDGDHGYGFPKKDAKGTYTQWPELLLNWLSQL